MLYYIFILLYVKAAASSVFTSVEANNAHKYLNLNIFCYDLVSTELNS